MLIKTEEPDNPADTEDGEGGVRIMKSLPVEGETHRRSTRSCRKQSLVPKPEVNSLKDEETAGDGGSSDSDSGPQTKKSSNRNKKGSPPVKRRRKKRALPLNMPSRATYLKQLEARKEAVRKRAAEKRAAMTPEQKEVARLKAKLRAREIRKKLSHEEHDKLMERRRAARERTAARRAAMTPEEKEAARLKEKLRRREQRKESLLTVFSDVQEQEDQRMLHFIKNQMRSRIRLALETPCDREKRLAKDREDKKKTGKKSWQYFPESREERALREILVREAFAVELGDDIEIKQFEEMRQRRLGLSNESPARPTSSKPKSKSQSSLPLPKHISRVDKEVISFWDHNERDWDGIISEDEDSDDSDVEEINDSEETPGEWAFRVKDIFNSRTQGKGKTKQDKKQNNQESLKSNVVIMKDSATAVGTSENEKSYSGSDFRFWDKQDLINVISSEKADRVLIIEAEIAERRAALAGETDEERKARIRLMIDDAKKTREHARMAFAKRKKQGAAGGSSENNDRNSAHEAEAAVRSIDPTYENEVSNEPTTTTTTDPRTQKERLAEYMRKRYDLLKVEWETWVGLRDTSAPSGSSSHDQISPELTGIVNPQAALTWLDKNMEDHRWGITTGASVKMGNTVPEAVKKYRLSLATIIDKDENRSGPNAKRVARETLSQLLTTERKILEEYFYGRRTYMQNYCKNSMKKLNPELLAERTARKNERLRERYKAKRLNEGKTYDPDKLKGTTIKDKETLMKELKGEIPKSTRGVTKTRWDPTRSGEKPRGKPITPVVRNGRVLKISSVRSTKPVEASMPIAVTNRNVERTSLGIYPKESHSATSATMLQPVPTLVYSDPTNPTTSFLDQPLCQPQKQSSRSKRKSKKHEEIPLPPPSPPPEPEEQDSDSDWAPADVDESLFDDDDSRGAGASLENSTTPPAPQETWISPPALEPFSTLNQNHLYFQSLQSHNLYPAAPAFSSSLNVGHVLPAFPTPMQTDQQNSTNFQSIPNVNSEVNIPASSFSQQYTASYASSEDSGPPALSSEDNSNSIPDGPPKQKRRGRPSSSRVQNKTEKKQSSSRDIGDRSQKKILSMALLRPEVLFSEEKVPTVAHPGLLIQPSKNVKSDNNAESETAVVESAVFTIAATENSSDQILRCTECSEEFEDKEKLSCHKTEKHSKEEVDQTESEAKDTDPSPGEKLQPRRKRQYASISMQCPLCEIVLNHQQGTNTFSNHLWTVHWKDERNADLGPCPVCLRTLKGQGSRFFFYLTRHVQQCHADVRKQTFIPGVKTSKERRKETYEKFYCILCSSSFPSYLPLAKHLDNGHSRACQVCGIVLQVQDHLKDHMQIFHPQETYIPQEVLSEGHLKHQVHCIRCLSKFIDTDHLKSHEENCREKKITSYKCWWNCSKSEKFESLKALENHHNEHHSQDTVVPSEGYDCLHYLYKCEVCNQRCSTLPYLRLHYMRAHPSAPPLPEVEILEPEMVPNTRPHLHEAAAAGKSSRKTANPEKQSIPESSKPPECDISITNQLPNITLHTHPTVEANAPAYTCGECFKGFTANEFCRLHKEYRKARRRCCRTCGAQYSHIESLIGHNRTKHGISAEENTRLDNEYEEQRLQVAKEKQEPILKCAVCLMSFVAKDFHIMHSTMGDVERLFCSYCPKVSFSQKRDLDKHLALCHSDPKTAAETTKRLEHMKKLKRDRERAKARAMAGLDWTCEECGAIFTLKKSLQRHIRNAHTGIGKKFQCPHCDQKSARIEQLRSHIKAAHAPGGPKRRVVPNTPRPVRIHIPDKQCPRCVRKFATERALQIHIEKIHGPETLCYACGETVKDIKAHNSVCPMGGMEEDALMKDGDGERSLIMPRKSTRNVQSVAKLPLFALLKIIKSHKEQTSQTTSKNEKQRTKTKKGKVKIKQRSKDLDIESELDESVNEASTRKTLNLRKPARKKVTANDCKTTSTKKGKISKIRSQQKTAKKLSRIPKPPKTGRTRRSRSCKRNKKISDSDEFTDEEVDKDLDNDDDMLDEIIVKEEVTSFEEDDLYLETTSLEDFEIKPEIPDADAVTCSLRNCPCDKGRWAKIVHSERQMVVPLVSCDSEVQDLQEKRNQLEAENERTIKKAEAERGRKRKNPEAKRKQKQRRRKSTVGKKRRKPAIELVDPQDIANSNSISRTPRIRPVLGPPPAQSASRSCTRGWTQLNHIIDSNALTEDSRESCDNDEEYNDPLYDPLSM